jgi:serine/threonine protein kinase
MYCKGSRKWKLTDFGICSEATSKKGRPTVQRRGTDGYRAPELLHPRQPSFTNKVDMWDLGCILHEFTHLRPAFDNDWGASRFDGYVSVRDFPGAKSKFVGEKVRETLQSLMNPEASQRPAAEDCVASYQQAVVTLSFDSLFREPSEGEYLVDTLQWILDRISSQEAGNSAVLADSLQEWEQHARGPDNNWWSRPLLREPSLSKRDLFVFCVTDYCMSLLSKVNRSSPGSPFCPIGGRNPVDGWI